MPDRIAPAYRFRGSVCPSEQVARPVAVHRNAATSTSTGGSSTASSATIDIFDVIDSWGGWWGISAGDVDRALAQVGDVDTLYVRLNSPGGEALEGVAIGNLLRAHRATVRITVYGLAASAASAIAMSGDVVNMAPGSMMMIHDAWNVVLGNPDELRAEAAVLDKLSDGYAALYAQRAGGTKAEWRDLMRAETWYTADDAVAAKLADAVTVDPAPDLTAADDPTTAPAGSDSDFGFDYAAKRFDLSVFRHAPAAHAATETPAATADGSTTHERSAAVAFTDAQLTTMRQQLGVASDADEATILAALGEALAESADPPAATTTPPAAPAASVPAGHVVIDEDVLAELRASAQAGQAARAQQLREERDATIQAAVTGGHISPARRAAWVAKWDADPEGARAAIEELTKSDPIFPVGQPSGYAGQDGSAADSVKPFTDEEADALGALAGLPKGALR